VAGHDLVPRIVAHVHHRAEVGIDGRIADQRVDAAPLLDGGVDQRLQVLLATDVAGVRDRFAALRANRGDDCLAGFELAARDHDFRAVLREALGDRAADAATGAGDERDLAGQIEQRRAFHRYFSSSMRPIWLRWTSSGPSTMRMVRALAAMWPRPKSVVTPAAPCAWIAQSTTKLSIAGAATLIIAISRRAALLPRRSILSAAFSTSSRAWSIMMRQFAMRSSQIDCSEIGLPNATREDRRRQMRSSNRSAT